MHHDETMHTHEHTHADGQTHSHEHTHPHDHEHEHTHGCDEHTCAGCSGCADPKQELMALMKYMVGHNTAHANELAQLAKQLQDLGENAAYEQIVLSNVQRIDCKDGMVYLTDLLDRQVVVEGEIVSVDLVGNTTIIRKTQK